MQAEDQRRLQHLPWHVPLTEWPEHGVVPLVIRRGESRHPVIFVESQGASYAIKETTPHMAEREIHNLQEIEFRGLPALSPVGTVTVHAPPIRVEETGIGGIPHYISGDRGYTVTKLARRVIPHALLFRLPLTRSTKRRLLGAVAVLMVELHEHGVYWGDPSLANVLIRIDGKRILAIMADAETAELFPRPVEEGLREQDLELFHESLIWQAEDLRQARGLEETEEILSDKDYRYFLRRYRLLSREHERLNNPTYTPTLIQFESLLNTMNRLGFALASTSGHKLQTFMSVLPGWYVKRVRDLLGIEVPRAYARRFYNTILGHQAILSRQQGRDVDLKEAAQHWYKYYHLPTILLLRQILTSDEDPIAAYFAIMDHKWKMSKQAGYEVPLDEAILDWAMQKAEVGTLGPVDPARIAAWWRGLEPVAQALEPPLIEQEKLTPLLSKEEQPLVQLPPSPVVDSLHLPLEHTDEETE